MSKTLIISLPLIIDNPIARWLGIHPLRDTKWEYLGGSAYIVVVEDKQLSPFLKTMRRIRWLNITNLFDDPVIGQFNSPEEATEFLDQILL